MTAHQLKQILNGIPDHTIIAIATTDEYGIPVASREIEGEDDAPLLVLGGDFRAFHLHLDGTHVELGTVSNLINRLADINENFILEPK